MVYANDDEWQGKQVMLQAFLILCVLILSACALGGRTPHPVEISSQRDQNLDCGQISEEIARNEQRAMTMAGVVHDTEIRNRIGSFVWPYMVDNSDAGRIEMRALIERNRYLERLKENKKCTDGAGNEASDLP